MAALDDSSTSSPGNGLSYANRDSRISKENLYMVLALWMERFPVEQELEKELSRKTNRRGKRTVEENEPYKKVGAVLVLPNNIIYAVDCSRNGVHGVARLLMAHPEILQDCKVFVSRKPCSLCAKLLVQSKVKRVFFLPIEPEYINAENSKDETSRVDNLFKVSEISQTVFVPRADKDVRDTTVKKLKIPKEIIDAKKKELLDLFWNETWFKKAKDDLPWPAFDKNMKEQLDKDFNNIMEWMASILAKKKEGEVFKEVQKRVLPTQNVNMSTKEAEHLITLARFLAERTDDPVTGVGAVIINEDKDIVGLGWNGFPTKALYGEFPRASKKDEATKHKKYPYIIHAEQNTLLMRNTKKIKGATLFVTKTPCNDCTPLIEMQGIKAVFLGEKLQRGKRNVNISYTKFSEKVDSDVFVCFETDIERRERSKAVKRLFRDEPPVTRSKTKKP